MTRETTSDAPRRPIVALLAGVLLGALVLGGLVAGPPAGAQGSSTASVDGGRVTVDVNGIPGHQVRVELQDDSIASTALITPQGTTQMVFDLPPGDYQLEVITFDPAGTPTTVGNHAISVAGPPPDQPGVEVTPGSPQDNRTLVRITGQAGATYDLEIAREGQRETSTSGEVGDDGTVTAVVLLDDGPWGYIVTLRNPSGGSPAALGEFTVDLGAPGPPLLSLVSPSGQNPATVAVLGPAGGTVDLTAALDDETVTASADLDEAGAAEVELDLPEGGTWTVSATATNLAGERSEAGTLEGGLLISDGPPLEVTLRSSESGRFAFSITTAVGASVRVNGNDPALQFEFTAEEETTEFDLEVAGSEHTIDVTATDEFGNRTRETLTSSSGGGGVPWGILGLIILGLLVALGVLALVKRQELIDWWNTRQYH